MMFYSVLFFSILSLVIGSSIPEIDKFPTKHRTTIEKLLGSHYNKPSSTSFSSSSGESHVFFPEDYGADPSGLKDSSDAFDKLINDMFLTHDFGEAFYDLGGAYIHLAGGHYALSRPLLLPCGFSNFGVRFGELRATSPMIALLQVGNFSQPTTKTTKGSCFQNFDCEALTIDGTHQVKTALNLVNGQYANIGPAVMIHSFTEYGIATNGTGGGFIHHSWLGEIPPSGHNNRTNVHATAISLDGSEHDFILEDIIVWSARIGIHSSNGANQFSGIHVWNLVTTDGGIGIFIEKGSGKVVDSYLDFTPLVIQNPTNMVVSNNLFLAKANLVLQAGYPKTVCSNLVVSNNRWASESKYKNASIIVNGNFIDVQDTVIESNAADSLWLKKGTRGTQTVSINEGDKAILDFSKDLVFPAQDIQEVYCSIRASEFVGWVVKSVEKQKVTILLSKQVYGQTDITCTVDQSKRTANAH
eukprot:g2833.t1